MATVSLGGPPLFPGLTAASVYGHLFPGNEAEAAGLLDAYLNRVGGVNPG